MNNLPDMDYCRRMGWATVLPPEPAPLGYTKTGKIRKTRQGTLPHAEYQRRRREKNLKAGLTGAGQPRKYKVRKTIQSLLTTL